MLEFVVGSLAGAATATAAVAAIQRHRQIRNARRRSPIPDTDFETTLKRLANASLEDGSLDKSYRVAAQKALEEVRKLRDVVGRSFDEAFVRWQRWSEKIRNELTVVDTYRTVWEHLAELQRRNPKLQQGTIVHEFLIDSYFAYCLTFIRRQTDSDERSVSLYRLLDELSRYSHAFTREWYVKRNAGENGRDHDFEVRHANECFDKFAGAGKDHVSTDMLLADAAELRNLARRPVDYVNTHLAHTDDRGQEVQVTIKDVNAVIDRMSELVCKYYLLLHYGTLLGTKATILDPWKDIFRIPWEPD